MEITALTVEELPALAELFSQFWGAPSSIEKMLSAFSRMAANPAYILRAAKHDGRLVGFGMGVVCEELYGDCRPFMVIEDLIVDQGVRRKGIGGGLMRELEKAATAQGCCQVIFVTEAERTEAQQFYHAMGYACVPYKGFKKKYNRIGMHQEG